jgi:hypothetical protein
MRALAALSLLLALPAAAVAGSNFTSSLRFVLALDADPLTGYKEGHQAACTRSGFRATAEVVALGADSTAPVLWDPAAAAAAVANITNATLASPALAGCCSTSLWCRLNGTSSSPSSIPSYSCFTHAFGGSTYTNYGWTVDNTSVPVFTCTDTSPSLAPAAASQTSIPHIGSSVLLAPTISYPSPRLRLEGTNFGTNAGELDIILGNSDCTDTDICQNTCVPCADDSGCGPDKLCTKFSRSGLGFCLRPCNADKSCPCSGVCYTIGDSYSSVTRCANPGATRVSDLCRGSFAWGPNVNATGMTDRIECTPTGNARLGGQAGVRRGTGRIRQLRAEADLAGGDEAPIGLRHNAPVVALSASLSASPPPLSMRAGADDAEAGSLSPPNGARTPAEWQLARVRGRAPAAPASAASSPESSSSTTTTTRRAGRLLQSGSIPTYIGTGFAAGMDRYSLACAGAGAAAAGVPGAYPVLVVRDGWASTGLGPAVAAANNATLPVFNVSKSGSGNSSSPSAAAAAVFASLPYTGLVPSYVQPSYACTESVDCPLIDLCSVPVCSRGASQPGPAGASGSCCTYVPSGLCGSSDSPLAPGQEPSFSLYLPLPKEVSAALPLPPPPRGNLDGSCVDPSNRNPQYAPRAILWDPQSVWYNATATSQGRAAFFGPYALSPSSSIDDGPMSSVTLSGWSFPFYGGTARTLYVAPNGFLRVVATDACSSSFMYAGCNFANDYAGIIGPLVTDYDPGSYVDSEIWTSQINAGPLWPQGGGVFAPPSSRSLCTSFSAMGLFNYPALPVYLPPDPSFTFHLCVYGDGGIRWRYGQVLGTASPAVGSWNATTVLPATPNSGPPDSTSWIAGVRSLSVTSGSAIDEALVLADYPTNVAEDISVSSVTEVLLSRGGVRAGGTVGLCSYGPVACASRSCGPVGTTVRIRWGGLACGLGLETLLPPTGSTALARPADAAYLLCRFGSVGVRANWTTEWDRATNRTLVVVECGAPDLPELAGQVSAAGTATAPVPLSLEVVLPTDPAAFALAGVPVFAPATDPAWASSFPSFPSGTAGGIGPPAAFLNVSARTAKVPLAVYGIVAVTYGDPQPPPAPNGSSPSLPASRVTVLLPSTLRFTYTNATSTCGCDAGNPSATCDACNVCGGRGSWRDCAGVCFGSASVDDCTVCSGGTTGRVPNSDKDCTGKCFGNNRDCGRPSPTPSAGLGEATMLLTTVVVIALFTCLFALFTVLAYFGWMTIMRQRAMDQTIEHLAAGDADLLGVPPGLSDAQMARFEVHVYDPDDLDFRDSIPGGGEQCSICMEDFKRDEHVRKLGPCRHTFHITCIDTWLSRSFVCPVCRAELRSAEEVAADRELRRRRAEVLALRRERNQVRAALGLQPIQGGVQPQQPQQQQQGEGAPGEPGLPTPGGLPGAPFGAPQFDVDGQRITNGDGERLLFQPGVARGGVGGSGPGAARGAADGLQQVELELVPTRGAGRRPLPPGTSRAPAADGSAFVFAEGGSRRHSGNAVVPTRPAPLVSAAELGSDGLLTLRSINPDAAQQAGARAAWLPLSFGGGVGGAGSLPFDEQPQQQPGAAWGIADGTAETAQGPGNSAPFATPQQRPQQGAPTRRPPPPRG